MEKSHPIKINNQLIYGRDKTWLESLHQNTNQLIITVEIDFEDESTLQKMVFNGLIFYSSPNSTPTKKVNGVLVGYKAKAISK